MLTNNLVLHGALISVIKVVSGTFFGLFVLFSTAFALIRKGLPYRRGLTLFLMLPCYISAGIIPTYFLFRELHLMNNFLVYILPWAFSFYNMIIIRSFLQELPVSIDESAKIDGANDFCIMWKITVPLSKPVLATVALWVAVGMWNGWMDTLLYVTERDLYPLTYIMMQLIKESLLAQQMSTQSGMAEIAAKPTPDTIKAATLIVTTIPIIMVYPFLQKYFIKGVSLGAVKE